MDLKIRVLNIYPKTDVHWVSTCCQINVLKRTYTSRPSMIMDIITFKLSKINVT